MKTHGIAVLVASFAVCLYSTGTAQSTNSFYQFVQDQSKRHYTGVPREVLAVYYGWYGPGQGGWKDPDIKRRDIANTVRYPVKGAYSSHDPEVLDWQIDQAKAHGITGFIVSWFGIGPDGAWVNDCLALLLQRAEKKNFKVSVYWERAPGAAQSQIDHTVGELAYLLKNYGTNNAFLKVEGKPVIFAYGRFTAQVPVTSWPEIIRRTRADAGDFLLFADGFITPHAYLFDGLHTYGGPKVDDDKLRSEYARMYTQGVALARKQARISCVAVGAGYDDRKQNKPGWWTDRQDGKVYRTLWEEAVKSNPDWILIGTWNEWPEGTEIEPSIEFGDKYLKITREYAQPFLRTPPMSMTAMIAPPRSSPGMTNRVDRLFAGRKIGALPGAHLEPVQMKDNTGQVQGDAVVYIEHHAKPLAPGKTVYAWMRTPEAFGSQDFYLSLYQFVSTRLKPVPPK
jgi:hypothetical protein